MGKDKLENRTGAESRSQITKGLVRSELKSKAPALVAGEPSNTYKATEQQGTCQCSDR